MRATATRHIIFGTLVGLGLSGVVSCGGAAPAENKATADEVTATWIKAFNAGDAAGLSALYADDGRSMPPGSAPITGRASIEAYWKNDLGRSGAVTTLTPSGSIAQGDLMHVDGTYDVKSKEGFALATGQYQQLWRRTDGQWKIQQEIWRLDPTTQHDPAMATNLQAAWTAAYNKGDADALGTLYHQDAILSTRSTGSVEGHEDIAAFWKDDFGGGTPKTTLTLRDAYVSGELAHLEGDYEVLDKGKTSKGHYVQLWMREDSTWRIHREVWWQ